MRSYFATMSKERKVEKTPSGKSEAISHADRTPYEVPVEGSLALLALGYRGLMAWRAKRAKVQRDNPGGR
jgi:hypothetical protein